MGFLVDTNVLSELRRTKLANERVLKWFKDVDNSTLFISVLALGEIRFGVEKVRLKDPVKATVIEAWLFKTRRVFASRILPVTDDIADRWGRVQREFQLPQTDGLIAATAIEHGLTIVTRNVKDFKRSGVPILNPFE